MAWNDRIREAAYTSPSGVRVTFDFENVRKSVDKKTTGFEFPDADGTYVQDLGHSGRRYPLRVFFWGDDYDLKTDIFEAILLERGTGKLEHPIYGVVDVVPFGTISRRDDLKTAANQAVIEVTFWETIGLIYPTNQSDPASDVLAAVDAYNIAAAETFDATSSLDSAVEQSSFKSSFTALLDSVSVGLQDVANTQDNVRKQFDTINDSINQGIDVLIDQPLTLASQTLQLIQAPARALTNIEARLSSYQNLAALIISQGVAIIGLDSRNSNEFHSKDLYASTYVTGSIVSVVNNQFITKTEALEAAENILAQLDAVVNWRDDNYQSLEQVDTGESYQQLQNAAALTAGFLVAISFSLKQERTLVLDRARTIIDLVGELYGSIDDQLDFFINSNNLSGSEILELPRGRSIVYYV
jgi:prophage DNA circulation protein